MEGGSPARGWACGQWLLRLSVQVHNIGVCLQGGIAGICCSGWVGLEFWIACWGGFQCCQTRWVRRGGMLETALCVWFLVVFGYGFTDLVLVRLSEQCRHTVVLEGWTDLGRRVVVAFSRLLWRESRRWCCGFSATALSCGRQASSTMSVWWASSKVINVCLTKVNTNNSNQKLEWTKLAHQHVLLVVAALQGNCSLRTWRRVCEFYVSTSVQTRIAPVHGPSSFAWVFDDDDKVRST